MSIHNVTILGGGVLGTQIALQSALNGYHVTIWLRSPASVERFKPRLDFYIQSYLQEMENAKKLLGSPMAKFQVPAGLFSDIDHTAEEDIDAMIDKMRSAAKDIKIELNLEKALADADLVIEATTENAADKTALFDTMAPVLPEKTILCTNSSTFMPSMFADHTGCPERFLSLHFANQIWRYNTAEIMGHPGTKQEYYDQVVDFADSIGMLSLPLKKEQPGYILNSMLVPFLTSAQLLWAKDVADPEVIDKTWKAATGAPVGPFAIMDVLGLKVAYDIISNNPASADPDSPYFTLKNMLKEKIDKGELGIVTGKGFYEYKK